MSEPYKMIAKLELMRAACGLRLPAYESRTLIVLASLINEKTGCAYPSRSVLATLVNIDERNVSRAVRGLQQRGFLAIAEQGDSRHSARYRIDVPAVMSARGVSTDTAAVSPQTRQGCLYRHGRGVSTDTAAVSLQTPEGQLRASEAQAKRQPKLLPASRSARGSLSRSRDPALNSGQPKKRNAWVANYKPSAEAAD